MAFYSFWKLRKFAICLSSGGLIAGIALCASLDAKKLLCPPSIKKWDFNWDNRDIAVQDSHKGDCPEISTVNRHLILIRHGQYNSAVQDDTNRTLTALGKEQCEILGKRLKSMDLPYKRMVVSTLTRARETASIISKHLPNVPVETCGSIREGAPFPPEPSLPGWNPVQKQYDEDGVRIEEAFRRYFYRADPSQEQDSYEIMVCHGNVIRYFICRALQLPPEAWLRFSLNHCSVSWVTIQPTGRVSCNYLGESGFMPPNMITVS